MGMVATRVDPSRAVDATGQLCTPTGCLPVHEVVNLGFLVCSGAICLLVGLSYLATGREAVSEERDRVASEMRAFQDFASRVDATSPGPTSPDAMGRGATLVVDSSGEDLEHVRRMYRETVMAVDHYEEDYGESMGENLVEEFGQDVATALVNGPGYTPVLQSVLLDTVDRSIEGRRTMLGDLDEEAASLGRHHDRLAGAQSTVEEIRQAPLSADPSVLATRLGRLDRAETAIVDAVQNRHRSLAERCAFELARYLYDELPIPSPVLAEAGLLVEEIRVQRWRTDELRYELR